MKRILSINGITELLKEFFAKRLNRSAAALSFYLILTLFPMLICVQWILGLFGEDIVLFLNGFSYIIPSEVLLIIEDYLSYTASGPTGLLVAGALTAIYTGASAFRVLSDTLREIFDSSGGNSATRFAFSFVYSVGFLAAVYLFAIIVVAGRWLINLFDPFFENFNFIDLSGLADLWNWSRFVILSVLSAGMLYIIYFFSSWYSPCRINVFPGAAIGSVLLTLTSGFFSWFISSSVKYSTVYGSLASMIILMIWLYFMANIILICALVNKNLHDHRADPKMKLHRSVQSFIKKK